jgi:hypothetical protein
MLVLALFTALFLASGCGSAVQQSAASNECLKDCNVALMTCLEESICLTMDGDQVPCQAECDAKYEECLDQCATH